MRTEPLEPRRRARGIGACLWLGLLAVATSCADGSPKSSTSTDSAPLELATPSASAVELAHPSDDETGRDPVVLGTLIDFDELPDGFVLAGEMWANRDGLSGRHVLLVEEGADDPFVINVGVLQLSGASFTPSDAQAELGSHLAFDPTWDSAVVDGRTVYYDTSAAAGASRGLVERLDERKLVVMIFSELSIENGLPSSGRSPIAVEDALDVYATSRIDLAAADCAPAGAEHISCTSGQAGTLWVDVAGVPSSWHWIADSR